MSIPGTSDANVTKIFAAMIAALFAGGGIVGVVYGVRWILETQHDGRENSKGAT